MSEAETQDAEPGSLAPMWGEAPTYQTAGTGGEESLSGRMFQRRWSIVAGACLLVAAGLLFMMRMDAAFVVATLGVVAWFWNERNRLRPPGIESAERFRNEDEEFEDRDEE